MNERNFLVSKDGPSDFPLNERGRAKELLGTISAKNLDEAYLRAKNKFGLCITELIVVPKEENHGNSE